MTTHCSEVGLVNRHHMCPEPVVPNQSCYGVPLNLCEWHLEDFKRRFEFDKQLRELYLLRGKSLAYSRGPGG